jgi:hypothetical protein
MTVLALIRAEILDVLDPTGDAGDEWDPVVAGSHPARPPVDGESGGRRVVGAGSHPPRTVPDPARPTLEATLLALMRGELREGLVCGEPVEGEGERVECPACGSVLEPAPREVIPGQLELLDS